MNNMLYATKCVVLQYPFPLILLKVLLKPLQKNNFIFLR